MADGALTDEGRAQREPVERATDEQCAVIMDALGDGCAELMNILRRGVRPSATPRATRPRGRTTWHRFAEDQRGLTSVPSPGVTNRARARLVHGGRVPDTRRVHHGLAGLQCHTCSAPSSSWTRSTRPESKTTSSSPAGCRSQEVQLVSWARTQTNRPSAPSSANRCR